MGETIRDYRKMCNLQRLFSQNPWSSYIAFCHTSNQNELEWLKDSIQVPDCAEISSALNRSCFSFCLKGGRLSEITERCVAIYNFQVKNQLNQPKELINLSHLFKQIFCWFWKQLLYHLEKRASTSSIYAKKKDTCNP